MIRKKKKKLCGPYGPVIIACHWPELARRLQIASRPAGQCLLWRPAKSKGRAREVEQPTYQEEKNKLNFHLSWCCDDDVMENVFMA